MSDLAIVFAVPSSMEEEAVFLSRSLSRYGDVSEVYAFVCSSEKEEVTTEALDQISSMCTVIEGEMPDADYPISAKLAAFDRASRTSQADWIGLFDTDTLALGPLTPPVGDAEVFARPVDIALNRYWASEESDEEWGRLETEFGIERRGRVASTVDNIEIDPYYNAGVVFTKNSHFPREWLSTTMDVLDLIDQNHRNADQVALGLLTGRFDIGPLSVQYNYPVVHYLWIPNTAIVLHYYELPHLIRAIHPSIIKKLQSLGVSDTIKNKRTLGNLIQSRYGFKRAIKGRIGRGLKRIGSNMNVPK